MPYAKPLTPEMKSLLERIIADPDGAEVSPEELWNSRIRSQYELECCFFEAFFRNPSDPNKSGVLSIWALPQEERDYIRIKADIAWKRLDGILRDYSQTNGPGIYEVRMDWQRVGWLNASGKESADRSAETIYSWLRNIRRPAKPDSCRITVTWSYDPDDELLRLLEEDLAETTIRNVEEAEKRIKDAQENLKWLMAVKVVTPLTGTDRESQ